MTNSPDTNEPVTEVTGPLAEREQVSGETRSSQTNQDHPLFPSRKTQADQTMQYLESNSLGIRAEAVRRFNQGWRVVPLRHGGKQGGHDWQNLTYKSAEAVNIAFSLDENGGREPNLGVVLGRKSKLVCVDLDGADPRIAALILPPTDLIDGRPGAPNSHWFYEITDKGNSKLEKRSFSGKLAGRVLVEVLADNRLVVLPPSFYTEKGEARAWVKDGEPAKIEYGDLLEAAGQAAAFCEIALIWRHLDGVRHDASLALIGGLVRAEIDAEVIKGLLNLIWPGQDKNEAHNAVESTLQRMEADEPFTGWKRFRELCGPGLSGSIDLILKWLGTDDDERPKVYIGAEIGALTDRAWAAFQKINDPPVLYQLNGSVVRVNPVKSEGDGGNPVYHPVIQSVGDAALRKILSDKLAWKRYNKSAGDGEEKWIATSPTREHAQSMLSVPSNQLPLPVISRVVSHPIFGADGSLRTEPGYHEGSQTFLWPGEGLTLEPIPQKPSAADVAKAKQLLFDELMHDFPFDSAESKANALAMSLLPYGRAFISGPSPFHFVTAPTQGSGKDLLIQSLGAVWNGRRGIPATTQTDNNEEWRKIVVAYAREGASTFYITNIEGVFNSKVLAGYITNPLIKERVLGANESFEGEFRVHWLGTGNNATPNRDMGRRIVPIKLDAKVSNPYARTGFKHALPSWALNHRAEITWALLTLWQNWLAKGRPKGDYVFGSFEEYAQIIGGVLDAAGVPGFLGNVQEFQDEAVEEDAEWQEFVNLWWTCFGSGKVKPKDLVDVAMHVDGFGLGDFKGSGQFSKLGALLIGKRGTVYPEYREDGEVVPDALTITHKKARSGYHYQLEHRDGVERRGDGKPQNLYLIDKQAPGKGLGVS